MLTSYGRASTCRKPASGIFLCLALIFPRSGQAEPVLIETYANPDHLSIVLVWPKPVTFQKSIKGRELLLQFDRAIEASVADDLPQRLPSWLEAVSTGFDTILLRAARDVDFAVDIAGHTVSIKLTLSVAPDASWTGEETKAQLRLDLLQAQLFANTGREGQALELLRRLASQHSANAQVLASLANLEHRMNRWRYAKSLYSRALQLEPGNEEIVHAQADLLSEQAPRIRFDSDRKMVSNGQREQMARLSGHGFITESLRIGIVYNQNDVDTRVVRRAKGNIESFRGVRRRGEIYLQQDFLNGSRIKGSLHTSGSTLGVSWQSGATDTRGQTTFSVDYRRPYWEFIEGVVDDAARDRIEVRRQHKLGTRLTAMGAAALNRYGINEAGSAATSHGFDGSLTYWLLPSNPFVAAEYGFDGEYRRSIHTRVDASGIPFNPLPLLSREVHTANVLIGNHLTRHLRAEGYTGFAKDRLGGSGPLFGVRLIYDRLRSLGAQIGFDRRLQSVNTGETVNRFGGYIFWRF